MWTKQTNKHILVLLVLILLADSVLATKVYNSDQDITGDVGGNTYWASKITLGDGGAPQTRVSYDVIIDLKADCVIECIIDCVFDRPSESPSENIGGPPL